MLSSGCPSWRRGGRKCRSKPTWCRPTSSRKTRRRGEGVGGREGEKMPRYSYGNGQYVPHAEAAVHIEDRGFQFADGVYEVWAVFDGKLADAEGHFARLERSLSEL